MSLNAFKRVNDFRTLFSGNPFQNVCKKKKPEDSIMFVRVDFKIFDDPLFHKFWVYSTYTRLLPPVPSPPPPIWPKSKE